MARSAPPATCQKERLALHKSTAVRVDRFVPDEARIQESIIGNPRSSQVLGGNHRWSSSVVISGEQRQAERRAESINVLGLDEDRLLAISGNQWQSVAISGINVLGLDEDRLLAISGNQWQSVAISASTYSASMKTGFFPQMVHLPPVARKVSRCRCEPT